MKKIIKLLATALFLVFALQGTVFATGISSTTTNPLKDTKFGDKGPGHSKHYVRSASQILQNKYGVKAEDMEKTKTEGKTFFDLAKSKGLNEADLKAAIISPKLKALDEMVATGQLTKEKAEEIKSKVKTNIDKWDGKIEDIKKHKEHKDND